jgi:hypothetical protein
MLKWIFHICVFYTFYHCTLSPDTASLSSEVFPDECDVASLCSQDADIFLDGSPTDPLRAIVSRSSSQKDFLSPSSSDVFSPTESTLVIDYTNSHLVAAGGTRSSQSHLEDRSVSNNDRQNAEGET